MATEDDADSVTEDWETPAGKCGLIFLIDARSSMFSESKEEEGMFNLAVKCCRTVLMNKIIARQKDLVGLVLFGTSTPDSKSNINHVTLLLELNYPNAEAVKTLDRILSDPCCVDVQQSYGSSDDFLLADALWYCSSLFSKSASGATLDEKRILVFTDDSDPHATHPDHAHMARKRAKDLNQLNISLELLPMGNDFDYSTFYKEVVEIVNGSPEPDEVDPSSRLEELLERVNRLDYRTRRYSKLKWDLGKGVSLGVSLYTLYRETVVISKEPLYRATNEPIKRVKQMFDGVSGELLLPSDVIESVTIGGQAIDFTEEDKVSLRKIAEPGMTLLGFLPASVASAGLHCGQPCFAYPEEGLFKGSRELMKALVDRCSAKEKVVLCCLTPRYRAITKYVLLVPSQETYDSEGHMLTPCGFHVIPLPFSNDTRVQTFEKSPAVDQSVVDIAKQIVNKLKFSYKPSNFKNPKLQQFWSHLEALALEYEAPETLEDDTLPDTEAQSARLGDLASKFNSACDLAPFPSGPAAKRSKANQDSSPSKRSKFPDENEINIVEDIKAAIKLKTVQQFKVTQLKEFLLHHGKTITGMKKDKLVETIYNLQF